MEDAGQGLRFRAGGILTDAGSSYLLFQDMKGEYIGHSYVNDVSHTGTVLVRGHHSEISSCELAYASGSLIHFEGHDNRLINCFLHDGDYAGQWSGADKGWERKTVDFTTGAGVTGVTIFMERVSETGEAFADNLGLPRNPEPVIHP